MTNAPQSNFAPELNGAFFTISSLLLSLLPQRFTSFSQLPFRSFFSFNPALTGREVLSFYAGLKNQPVAQALELLDRVGLGAASTRRVGTYSKGMRQRLGLAQALLGTPRLLLLDEPTTGLDPALRLEFYDIVEALRLQGATVVLSSHALAELGERAGRVIIMKQGSMVANGSLDALRHIVKLPARI